MTSSPFSARAHYLQQLAQRYHTMKGGHFSPRAFPITSFYPSYGTTNPQWDATAFSLPPVVFDGPDTSTGGTLTISPLCAPIPA